jgi:hypothetical protein
MGLGAAMNMTPPRMPQQAQQLAQVGGMAAQTMMAKGGAVKKKPTAKPMTKMAKGGAVKKKGK